MQYCQPKTPVPCHRYDRMDPLALIAFVKANGGTDPAIILDGTAHILTVVKGEPRIVYLKPGAWLRALGPCQFSAVTDTSFRLQYDIVEAPQIDTGNNVAGVSEAMLQQLADQMNGVLTTLTKK